MANVGILRSLLNKTLCDLEGVEEFNTRNAILQALKSWSQNSAAAQSAKTKARRKRQSELLNKNTKIVGNPLTTSWIWARFGHPSTMLPPPVSNFCPPSKETPNALPRKHRSTLGPTLLCSLGNSEHGRKQTTSTLHRDRSLLSSTVPEYRSDLLGVINSELARGIKQPRARLSHKNSPLPGLSMTLAGGRRGRSTFVGLPSHRKQLVWRRDQQIFESRRLHNAAALRLQRWWRGVLACQVCTLLRRVRDRRVLQLQSYFRMYAAKSLRRQLWRARVKLRLESMLTVASVFTNELARRRRFAGVLSKYGRGYSGRRLAKRMRAARAIQAIQRGILGRMLCGRMKVEQWIVKKMARWRVKIFVRLRRRAVLIIERYRYKSIARRKLMRAIEEVTLPLHMARVLQRSVRDYWFRRTVEIFSRMGRCAIKIQTIRRMQVSKREKIRRRQSRAANIIQRAALKKLSRLHLWQYIAARHFAAVWLQRRMRLVWLRRRARYLWLFLRCNMGRVLRILAEKMLKEYRITEASRVFKINELYREALISGGRDLLRLKVLQQYRDISREVRQVFLWISTEGINNPSKAFKLARSQFVKFLKETKIIDYLSTPAQLDIIFIKCNSNTFDGADESDDEDEDRTLELDEFVEALIRLAKDLQIPEVQTAGDCADKLSVMHKMLVAPVLAQRALPEQLELDAEETAQLEALLVEHRPKLKKLFKFYAGAGDDDSASEISCDEFLQFAKECGLPMVTLSYSKCLGVFIESNQEEVDGFIAGTLTEELAEALQMDLDEFINAIRSLVLRITEDPRAHKKKSRLMTDFFASVFQQCPHYHLNLVDI